MARVQATLSISLSREISEKDGQSGTNMTPLSSHIAVQVVS